MKRLLSVIMVLTLIVSTIGTTTAVTFAGTTDSSELTKAIAVVKKVIEIPEKLSEFTYSYEESEEDSNICLNWNDPEGNAYASACVSKEGHIIYYNYYDYELETKGLAKITKVQAKKIAEGYINKLLPKTAGTFKLVESLSTDYGEDYRFNYTMYVNDIPCDFVDANITISKYSGKISSYDCRADIKDLSIKHYPTKDKIIKLEDAKKIYISELGIKLRYLSDYNYSKNSLKIFTAYMTDCSNRAIDANTGKAVKLYNEYILYNDAATKEEAKPELAVERSESEIKYTEEELKEIELAKNLIDKNQADKIARKLLGSIGNQKLTSVRLMEDRKPTQEYQWQLNYEKDFVRLDAQTGILISFNSNREYDKKSDIGLEKAKIIAENYIGKVAPDKQEQVIWTNENTIDNRYGGYGFVYTRQVNGISFDDNSIYIFVSKSNGDILSYSRNWYEKTSFPNLEGIITKEKAFDIADELGGFGLIYKKDLEGKVVLVYDFENNETYIIDAYKGLRLDYTGESYKEFLETTEYTDIAGNWAEQTILELKNNGYYLEGDKFSPKAATTQIDFFKYLYSLERNYYADDEEFYKMLVDFSIITKEEINAKSNITRQEAAKFVTRYLGIDKLAKESSVFKNVHTDKIDKSYLGYASAVYALDIMKGDSKGRFNGKNNLTHAETATLILNILKSN